MYDRDEIVGYTNGVYELCARAECFEGDAGFMAIPRKDARGEDHNLVCNSCGEYLLADEIAAEEAYYKAEYMREKALAIEVLENESAQDHWDQLIDSGESIALDNRRLSKLVDEADNLRKEAKERG